MNDRRKIGAMDQIVHRVLQFDRFELDLARGYLRMNGRDIEMPPKPFEVLRHLAENAGRLVSKEELYEAVVSRPAEDLKMRGDDAPAEAVLLAAHPTDRQSPEPAPETCTSPARSIRAQQLDWADCLNLAFSLFP
jgi:hypothetical protein